MLLNKKTRYLLGILFFIYLIIVVILPLCGINILPPTNSWDYIRD